MAKKKTTKAVKTTETTIKPQGTTGCPKGQVWSPSLGKCVDNP